MSADRRGFVLLSVLWVLVGLAMLALGTELAARAALTSTHNRIALTAASWRAEGCLARVHAAAHEAMTHSLVDSIAATWDALDRAILAAPIVRTTSCRVAVRPAGAAISVNQVDAAAFRKFLEALSVGSSRIDSLTDALLDWRDLDTIPRTFGAERSWYRAMTRLLPRDGPLADRRELLHVRGFERFGDTLTLIRVDDDRVPVSHAPVAVVAALPGMSPAVLARIAELRAGRHQLTDLMALGMTVPAEDRTTLIEHAAELSRLATPRPERWLVTVTAIGGTPEVTATSVATFARAGTRVAIVARR